MKVTFASIVFQLDFESKEEAENYKIENIGKHWWFGEISKVSSDTWTMEVRRPYKDYNGGW